MLDNAHTFKSSPALHPLLGTPILSKEIKEHDIVLFAYNETFSHIIPNGKLVLEKCAHIAAENQLQALEIPLQNKNVAHEKILAAINAACQTLGIKLPTLTPTTESQATEHNDIFNQAVRAAIPRLKQCRETLVTAIVKGQQEIVDIVLQHPLVRNNIQLYTDALKAAAKVNDAARVDSLLADDSPLSLYKNWFSAIALQEAASSGHVDLVKHILNPDFIFQHLMQVIDSFKAAAMNGHLQVVRELLAIPEIAANIDADFNEAFRQAAQNDHLGVVRELLTFPAVNTNVSTLKSSLTFAAKNGHISIVRELLTIPEVKTQVANNDNEALRLAVENGHLELVSELLGYPEVKAQMPTHANTLFLRAAQNGHFEVTSELLKFLTVNEVLPGHYWALVVASKKGNIAALRELLAMPNIKAQLDALVWPPEVNELIAEVVHVAAANGHLEVLRELLAIPRIKTQVTAENNQALRMAATNGHLDVVRELLAIPEVKTQAAINNNEALRIAATNGHLDVVRELLAIPSVKAQVAAESNQALRMAAANGHLDIVRKLLAFSEVATQVAINNNEAFRMAATNGHLEVVRELLAIQNVKEQVAAGGNLALRMAAQNGHQDVVRELLAIPEVKEHVTVIKNETFRMAAANGHLEVVRELLTLPQVRAQVTEISNWALRMAAKNGHLEVVRELLTLPEVKAQVAVMDNWPLRMAAKIGHFEMVHELLTFPEVAALAAANDNQALKAAIEEQNIDMVRELLQYPAVCEVIDINHNEIFKLAARDGKLLIVKELLRYPKVLAKVSIHNNAALRYAIEEERDDVINLLLTIKAVKDNLTLEQLFSLLLFSFVNNQQLELLIESYICKQCLSKEQLLDLVSELNPEHHAAQHILQRYLTYYSYQPIPADLTGQECISAIENSIKHSFTDFFNSPQAHAGKLLQSVANVAALKKTHHRFAGLAGNTESAMEESFVNEAINRFKDKIQPLFEKRFSEMGGVEGIESKIIGLLLGRKVAQLKQYPTENSLETIVFIETNKAALMQREEAILVASRNYFTSHTDTFDIALRAFDCGAPSHGWEKLFVAPKKDKEASSVFSTRAASSVSLTLKQTTDITRKILCYAHVIAHDESLNDEQKLNISDALVHYLAEISRAHNNTDQDSDNPSCYPGTITRLDLIFQKHPKFAVPKELFKTTNEIASQMVVKAFNAALSLCKSNAEKLELYEALTLFSHKNAREILHKPELVLTTEGELANLEHLLRVRKSFFEKYFGEQGNDGIEKINAVLLSHQLFIDEETTEIALLPLLNMSEATPATTFSLTEAYQRASPEEKPEEQSKEKPVVKNPYEVHYQGILNLYEKFPMPISKKEQMARAKYTENRIKAIYFDYIAKGTNDNDTLKEQTESTYQEVKAQIDERNSDINVYDWSLSEQMITALMDITGLEREKFPTENSIHKGVAGKKHLRDSHEDNHENAENTDTKTSILYNTGSKVEKKRRDEDIKGDERYEQARRARKR